MGGGEKGREGVTESPSARISKGVIGRSMLELDILLSS
jgi:hypothetical protein